MRLIDADALKRDLEISPYNDYDDYLRTERLIDDAPTVEERPKHKWIIRENGNPHCIYVQCPNCGKKKKYQSNYCPDCGADMRGEEK